MVQTVARIIETYGSAVTLVQDGFGHPIRAFFQPVRPKGWQYLEGDYSPLGEIHRGQYVYIGPLKPAAKAGDQVIIGDKIYWLRRCELIYDANGPVYCWGMCVERGGADNWGRS